MNDDTMTWCVVRTCGKHEVTTARWVFGKKVAVGSYDAMCAAKRLLEGP